MHTPTAAKMTLEERVAMLERQLEQLTQFLAEEVIGYVTEPVDGITWDPNFNWSEFDTHPDDLAHPMPPGAWRVEWQGGRQSDW